jgi:hypothetical protein
MKRNPRTPRPRAYVSAEEETSRQLMFFGWMFWLALLAFMVLRDPAWRLLHAERLVSGIGGTAVEGWTEMDARTVRRLAAAPGRGQAGVPALEDALLAELERRRAVAGDSAPAASRHPPQLRTLARTLAAARVRAPDPLRAPPELRYPEVYVALQHPRSLVRTVELHQRTPGIAPAVAAEVVAGWLNDARFRGALEEAAELHAAVGVVRDGAGESIQVLLVEPLLSLDAALPAAARPGERLALRGRRGADSVSLFLKRPTEPGFHPLALGGAGGAFTATVPLPDAGVYALRTAVRDRLSDPLPVVVR